MDDKQFKQIINHLNEIDNKLSILVALQRSISKPPELGKEEKAIVKLCNGKNTIEDIMRITHKGRSNIKSTLSHLRKKGVIKSTTINDRTVFVRT